MLQYGHIKFKKNVILSVYSTYVNKTQGTNFVYKTNQISYYGNIPTYLTKTKLLLKSWQLDSLIKHDYELGAE